MSNNILMTLVNTFGTSLISITGEMGLPIELIKSKVSRGVNVQKARCAALVGIVGGNIQGTIVIMMDIDGFTATVNSMSGGMIKPDTDDPVAMSVIGELSNMVSGRALTQAAIPGVDVTPPQLISGEGIKTIPAQSPNIKSFTLPFVATESGGKLYLVLSFHSLGE